MTRPMTVLVGVLFRRDVARLSNTAGDVRARTFTGTWDCIDAAWGNAKPSIGCNTLRQECRGIGGSAHDELSDFDSSVGT
jgi:hypothetical protein